MFINHSAPVILDAESLSADSEVNNVPFWLYGKQIYTFITCCTYATWMDKCALPAFMQTPPDMNACVRLLAFVDLRFLFYCKICEFWSLGSVNLEISFTRLTGCLENWMRFSFIDFLSCILNRDSFRLKLAKTWTISKRWVSNSAWWGNICKYVSRISNFLTVFQVNLFFTF